MSIQLLACKYRRGCKFFDCALQKKRLFTLEEIGSITGDTRKPLYCARNKIAATFINASLEIDGNVFNNDKDYMGGGGARVKLIPGNYSMSKGNPEIGSAWECFGTLTHYEKGYGETHVYKVAWDNHTTNSYKLGDLILINNNCRSIWDD